METRLEISFEKSSSQEHVLAYRRADGSGERIALNRRSFLHHDFAHLAVEQAFGRADGVFGRLASGVCYGELMEASSPGGMEIEAVVVRLQTSWRDGKACDEYVAAVADQQALTGVAPPAWTDDEGLRASWAMMRDLDGRWRATPMRGTMTVEFSISC